MSIALLEAMASGLPVVVTDTGGTTELVLRNINGEIVRWAEVDELKNALHRLVDDPRRRQEFGRAGRERALAFGWPSLAEQYLALCRKVAGHASSGLANIQQSVSPSTAMPGLGHERDPL